jgi:hypothetical protein
MSYIVINILGNQASVIEDIQKAHALYHKICKVYEKGTNQKYPSTPANLVYLVSRFVDKKCIDTSRGMPGIDIALLKKYNPDNPAYLNINKELKPKGTWTSIFINKTQRS